MMKPISAAALLMLACAPAAAQLDFSKFAIKDKPACLRVADQIASTPGVFFGRYIREGSAAEFVTNRTDVKITFNCITGGVIIEFDRPHADAAFISLAANVAGRVRTKAGASVRECLASSFDWLSPDRAVSCSRVPTARVVVIEAKLY